MFMKLFVLETPTRGSVSEDSNIPSVKENIMTEVPQKIEEVSMKIYFQIHLLGIMVFSGVTEFSL